MTKAAELSKHLANWLQLTEAETEAIQACQWRKLAEIQTSKARLQSWLSPETCAQAGSRQLADQIGKLVSLEARNQELLAMQQRKVRQKHEDLERANRNVHRLQLSYSRPPASGWSSYS
jgi:hypothetical protein